MKHIKLYEFFGPFGAAAGNTSRGPKTKVTIEFESENPDSKYGATAVGISSDPSEAATFALAAAYNFIINAENEVLDLEEATSMVMDNFMRDSDAHRAIMNLSKGTIKSDIFSDHGTESNASASVQRVGEGIDGGYIVDDYSEEFY